MDHVCYRVETEKQYKEIYNELLKNAILLGEDIIGGRMIANFKLLEPIHVEKYNRWIQVIELPMPKAKSFYATGFEHAELVIHESMTLEEFALLHPTIPWDKSGLAKSLNADLRVRLRDSDDGRQLNVKFHKLPLERVIELETEMKKTQVV
ncbi:hypothetical protein HDV02_004573 [Globomyces sp. JEL0801]|nr:hypothetical protein HDV02_004573 [Globomyces sp. JEL0801]